MATMPPFLQSFINGPRLPKLVLGAVGAVAILVMGWFLILSPVQTRIDGLTVRNDALQLELTQARAQVAELARFRRELAELEKKLLVLRDKLPTERETPGVYRNVSDAAHEAGLGVALFQPKPAQPREYVNEIPITLTAQGGYHQLGKFFERVARLPRIVTIGEIKMTGLGKSRDTVKADLTLATYTYRPEGPGAPRTPGGTPAPAPPNKAALPSAETRS